MDREASLDVLNTGESSETLAAALAVLQIASSPECASGQAREDAAKVLVAEVESWAMPLAKARYGSLLRSMAGEEVRDIVADAKNHLMEVALRITNRFRGTTDAEARDYCQQVFRHKLSNLLKMREREHKHRASIVDLAEVDAEYQAYSAARASEPAVEDAEDELLRMIASARRYTRIARESGRPLDVAAFWMEFGRRAGQTVQEQVAALSALLGSRIPRKQLEARAHKLRHWGKLVLRKSYAERIRQSAASANDEAIENHVPRVEPRAKRRTGILKARLEAEWIEALRQRALEEGRSVGDELTLILREWFGSQDARGRALANTDRDGEWVERSGVRARIQGRAREEP